MPLTIATTGSFAGVAGAAAAPGAGVRAWRALVRAWPALPARGAGCWAQAGPTIATAAQKRTTGRRVRKQRLIGGLRKWDGGGRRVGRVYTSGVRPKQAPRWPRSPANRALPPLLCDRPWPAVALTPGCALTISLSGGGPHDPPKSFKSRGFHVGRARPEPFRVGQRPLRQRLDKPVAKINALEPDFSKLSDDAAARPRPTSSASGSPRAKSSTICWPKPSPRCARRPSARSASAISTCS